MTVPVIVGTAHGSREDGPLLVLGPSLGSDSAVLWGPVIPLLADRYRIISWDLPGHGVSPAAREAFSVHDLADAVIGLVDEAGADRALLAGVSVGGATSLAAALARPDRVAKVATVCSAARLGTVERWTQRAAMVREQSTSALVVSSGQTWFAPGSVERVPEVAGRLFHALQDADDESYALVCEALRDFDIRDRLAEVTVPVLAVYGEHDQATTREQLEAIAEGVQDGRVIGIADAAHLAPAENPEAVAKALRDFFG